MARAINMPKGYMKADIEADLMLQKSSQLDNN